MADESGKGVKFNLLSDVLLASVGEYHLDLVFTEDSRSTAIRE
jgi:hypothetical protein